MQPAEARRLHRQALLALYGAVPSLIALCPSTADLGTQWLPVGSGDDCNDSALPAEAAAPLEVPMSVAALEPARLLPSLPLREAASAEQ